jgi:formylglycine-generating enzyme required for sulfatase activity
MVVVPKGTFVMGDESLSSMRDGSLRPHGPLRHIRIDKAFAAGRFEVTEAEFYRFTSASGHVVDPGCTPTDRELAYHSGSKHAEWDRSQSHLPVVCVTWRDTQAYTEWLSNLTGQSYRLLTEAEWEYIATAGSNSERPMGHDVDVICGYANVFDESAKAFLSDHSVATVPDAMATCDDGAPVRASVGSYGVNSLGLHDLTGNVWEWVADCSVLPYPDRPTDGSPVMMGAAECTHRSIRGGSWRTRLERQRITFRGRDPEHTSSDIFGFRVARNLRD